MIYCVEDEINIRELLIYTLETTGFSARGFSSGKELRAALREELSKQGMGRIAVIGTDKSDGIRARIELVCMLLMQGRYHVAEHLAPWHEALQMATWDEAAYEKGEWMRLDNGSYPVDALDSSEYSIYPYAGYLATVG